MHLLHMCVFHLVQPSVERVQLNLAIHANSEFIPNLEARAIPLPQTNPPFSFVIANTLVTSNKKVTAKHHYNLRVRPTFRTLVSTGLAS